MARRVIIDTNFLLIPAREQVDVFSEIVRVCPFSIEFFVMDGTFGELESLSVNGSGKDRTAVKLAKTLISAKKVRTIPHSTVSVDDAIVEESGSGDIVATMDLRLRKRLKEKGVDVAVLRSRKHVVIVKA